MDRPQARPGRADRRPAPYQLVEVYGLDPDSPIALLAERVEDAPQPINFETLKSGRNG